MTIQQQFVNYENLKQYTEYLQAYIDQKITEAIEAYRIEDENNDNVFNDQSEEITE